MPDSFDIAQLAAILSLDVEHRDEEATQTLVISRHGYSVALPAEVVEALDTDSARGRHLAYGVLFGARLAIDRSACDFDVSQERPEKPAQVFHHHEIPSVYGDRLPRLVPVLALEWFEALTAERCVSTEWHIDGLAFVYILETGKHLHVLAQSDLGRLEMTREKMLRDARHALFYDSYKLKPRQKERTEAGRVRTFRTVEGLGASRAMLLPDFDYDAARENGSFSVPSRDTMVVGRPEDKAFSEAIFERVAEVTAELVESEAFPLCSMVYRLTANEVHEGEFVGRYRLPATAEQTARLSPPASIRLEQEQ